MKRFFLFLSALYISSVLYPQDFFRGDFDKGKDYVILVNPTAGNIDVVNFLVKKKLLDVDFDRSVSSAFTTPARNMIFQKVLTTSQKTT